MEVQCCVCKKVLVKEAWQVFEPKASEHIDISHGYCPECCVVAFREIRESKRRVR